MVTREKINIEQLLRIFGFCKCKTRFHIFRRNNVGDNEDGCNSPYKVTGQSIPKEEPCTSPLFSIIDSELSVTPSTFRETSISLRKTDSVYLIVEDDIFNLMLDFDTEELRTVDV